MKGGFGHERIGRMKFEKLENPDDMPKNPDCLPHTPVHRDQDSPHSMALQPIECQGLPTYCWLSYSLSADKGEKDFRE